MKWIISLFSRMQLLLPRGRRSQVALLPLAILVVTGFAAPDWWCARKALADKPSQIPTPRELFVRNADILELMLSLDQTVCKDEGAVEASKVLREIFKLFKLTYIAKASIQKTCLKEVDVRNIMVEYAEWAPASYLGQNPLDQLGPMQHPR